MADGRAVAMGMHATPVAPLSSPAASVPRPCQRWRLVARFLVFVATAVAATVFFVAPTWFSDKLRAFPAAQVQRVFWPVIRRLQFPDYDTVGWYDYSVESCRAPRFKEVFGNVTSLEPHYLMNCVMLRMSDIIGIGTNVQPVDLSYRMLNSNTDIVLLSEKDRSRAYQLDVMNEGDSSNWDVIRTATRSFGGASCLDQSLFCDLTSVMPIPEGYLVLDRNRLQEYNFTWLPDDSVDARTLTSTYIGTFGHLNSLIGAPEESLAFPRSVAEYRPHNSSFISEDFPMTDMFPLATNRFLAVSDTGNERVILLNATLEGQFDYVDQFGVTGEASTSIGPGALAGFNETHLHWPWGLAFVAPAWESILEPVFANLFVADRKNNRLVKLDLGTPYEFRYGFDEETGAINYDDRYEWRFWERVELRFGGQYPEPGFTNYEQGLQEPVGVAIYRHYVMVAEAQGNAISVLMVNYRDTTKFLFVTKLLPAPGTQLTGNIAVSPRGYIWYLFAQYPLEYGFASSYFTEALRESIKPSLLEDFRIRCFNLTYHEEVVLKNATLFIEVLGYGLNISRVNWLFPEAPNFLDIANFNVSNSFNFELFNETVYAGQMVFCIPPPLPTAPPMMSGDADGWSGSNTGLADGATSLRTVTPALGLLGLPQTLPPLPAFLALAVAAW